MIDTFLFIRRDRILSPEALAHAISKAGFELKIPSEFDPAPREPVFLKCSFESLESGFELSASEYSEGDWKLTEDELQKLKEVEVVLQFTTFSNAQEIAGAVTAVAAYAIAAEGIIGDDFFEERLVGFDEAREWADRLLPNARSQFNGPSKLRE